jgi:flagellar FliL protein
MAEETTKKDQENPENPDEKKKGGLLKFILIPVVLVVQAVGAYFIVFNILLQEPGQASEETPAKEEAPLEVGQFYEINDIVVNPAGTAGKRFLVIEMALESGAPEVVEEAGMKEIWIRDAIISILTRKTPEELLDYAMQNALREEILETLNLKLTCGKFDKLYFKKYIMQ